MPAYTTLSEMPMYRKKVKYASRIAKHSLPTQQNEEREREH
jgi:hypothetical protein